MPPATPSDPIHVLLVEDNPGDARLLRENLSGAQIRFEVECVNRLHAAIERLRAGGIDVVLSDLSLPDSQGIETFRKLHESSPQTPILVLSGLDDEALAVQTVELGAQDYLVKGHVDRHLLVRAIRYAIERSHAEQALGWERNLLRELLDNIPDRVYFKDCDSRFVRVNPAMVKLFEHKGVKSAGDIIGKTDADFFSSEEAQKTREDERRVMSTGEPIIGQVEKKTLPDGHPGWTYTTKLPLRDRNGKIIGTTGISRDITAMKQLEETLAHSNEELRQKNTEMEDDLQMASEIQEAFLPQQLPTFPLKAEKSALRFYSKYLPSGTVGGDFFHVLPLSETLAGVFICDVMGHGVRAALVTAILRALVEELSYLGTNPGEFLSQVNRALLSILRRTRTPLFASAFYLSIDVNTGKLLYANAGHPKPLVLRRGSGVVEPLSGSELRPGPALGVFDHSEYATSKIKLAAHDLLVLFTDGLFEVEGSGGQLFDEEKLLAIVGARLNLPAEKLFDETLAEVLQFSQSQKFEDDVCLVGIEFEGSNNRGKMSEKSQGFG